MAVYYRGPRARITDEVFEVFAPKCQVYMIRALQVVHVVEVDRSPLQPMIAGSSGVAGAAVLWIVADGNDVVAMLAVLLGFMAAASAAGSCVGPRVRSYELWALYDGASVRLFQTAEAREFGQVRRALLRAIEIAEDA
jgi:hypothetical protein